MYTNVVMCIAQTFHWYLGVIQVLSMCASLSSIILHVEVGNGFIRVQPGIRKRTVIINGMKMMPTIFISTTFRTFSLVLMSSCLRYYAAIPILVIVIIQTTLTKCILCDTKSLKEFLMSFAPYAVMSLVSGPILKPSPNNEIDQKLNEQRKKWFLYDSIATLVVYGITLSVTIILWERTSLLQQNLSTCAFDFVVQNMTYIACLLQALGFCHFLICLMCFMCIKR